MKKNVMYLLLIVSFHHLFAPDQITIIFENNEEKMYYENEIQDFINNSQKLKSTIAKAEVTDDKLKIDLPFIYLNEFSFIQRLLEQPQEYNKELYNYYQEYGPIAYNHLKKAIISLDITKLKNNLLPPITENTAKAIWYSKKRVTLKTPLKAMLEIGKEKGEKVAPGKIVSIEPAKLIVPSETSPELNEIKNFVESSETLKNLFDFQAMNPGEVVNIPNLTQTQLDECIAIFSIISNPSEFEKKLSNYSPTQMRDFLKAIDYLQLNWFDKTNPLAIQHLKALAQVISSDSFLKELLNNQHLIAELTTEIQNIDGLSDFLWEAITPLTTQINRLNIEQPIFSNDSQNLFFIYLKKTLFFVDARAFATIKYSLNKGIEKIIDIKSYIPGESNQYYTKKLAVSADSVYLADIKLEKYDSKLSLKIINIESNEIVKKIKIPIQKLRSIVSKELHWKVSEPLSAILNMDERWLAIAINSNQDLEIGYQNYLFFYDGNDQLGKPKFIAADTTDILLCDFKNKKIELIQALKSNTLPIKPKWHFTKKARSYINSASNLQTGASKKLPIPAQSVAVSPDQKYVLCMNEKSSYIMLLDPTIEQSLFILLAQQARKDSKQFKLTFYLQTIFDSFLEWEKDELKKRYPIVPTIPVDKTLWQKIIDYIKWRK